MTAALIMPELEVRTRLALEMVRCAAEVLAIQEPELRNLVDRAEHLHAVAVANFSPEDFLPSVNNFTRALRTQFHTSIRFSACVDKVHCITWIRKFALANQARE